VVLAVTHKKRKVDTTMMSDGESLQTSGGISPNKDPYSLSFQKIQIIGFPERKNFNDFYL